MKKRYSDSEVMAKNFEILSCPSDAQGPFIWMEGAIQNLLDISSGSCHSFPQFILYWLSMGTSFQPERKQEIKKMTHRRKRRVSLVPENIRTDTVSPGKRPPVQALCYMNYAQPRHSGQKTSIGQVSGLHTTSASTKLWPQTRTVMPGSFTWVLSIWILVLMLE